MPSINTFSIETPKGVRSFHLYQGNICDSPDDVIIVSTHANPLLPPSGEVVRALHERYSFDFSQLEPLIAPRATFGTFRLTDKRCGDKTILVVRIPGADRVSEENAIPLEVFKEALWTIYGSLAALEFKGLTFRSISLPVLAGRRDYLITDILPLILESAIRWLRSSKSTEDISLYIYEQVNFSEWYQGMDHILGRKYFDTAKDSILMGYGKNCCRY